MPMNRWVKTALVVFVGLVAVGLRWPFGDESSGPVTYENDEYGFTITYDGRLSELPIEYTDPAMASAFSSDFEIGFFDASGPSVEEDFAADGVSISVIEVGEPMPAGDPRVEHLDDLVQTIQTGGDGADLQGVREIEMKGCAVARSGEYTDTLGRRVVDYLGIAGGRLFWVQATATAETVDDIWPLLTEAVESFTVDGGVGEAASPRTYEDPKNGFAVTCDRRLLRTPVDEEPSEGYVNALSLSDVLSGTDADGYFRDAIVIGVQELGVTLTEAQRNGFARDTAPGLAEDGWKTVGRWREVEVDACPAYRFEWKLPDDSSDAMYAVFSGTKIYFIEGFAQQQTWREIEPLFEEAVRSFDVL
jgi:hypothetical protein